MRQIRALALSLATAVCLGGAAAVDAHETSTTQTTSYTTLRAQRATGTAMVDGVSMRTAARNTMYACRFTSGAAGYGFSWVSSSNTISFADKPVVEGSVSWTSQYREVTSCSTLQIGSNGLPNHYTGTFPVSSSTEAGQSQYHPNPSSVASSRIYAELPVNPVVASTPTCVNGVVGILFTGAMLFDALDADGRDAVANEIQDQCEGHPETTGTYHYHHVTNCFTDSASGHSVQIGWALDGFGIYGSKGESGTTLTNADLDECHGHTHSVTQADGATKTIYHYHGNREFPYVVGCFRGSQVLSVQNLCALTTPATGLWYTTTAGGRGYAIESNASQLFIGIYTYTSGGDDVWYVASCMLGHTTCSGTLQAFTGGTTLANLGVANTSPSSGTSPGTYSVTFSSSSAATVTITPTSGSATSYSLVRYPLSGSTVSSTQSWAPESGWWWSPSYSGTGWLIESQGTSTSGGITTSDFFAVGYAYGSTGSPGQANWYVGTGSLLRLSSSTSTWTGDLNEYVNGPTLTGSTGTATSAANAGTATMQFTSTTTGTITLPNGRQIDIQRYRY
ncbi:MAG: YHYH protein [Alphaproteobacteria bacterium]|nr:YHYH protein [Alphaproteobacteria bacterium]